MYGNGPLRTPTHWPAVFIDLDQLGTGAIPANWLITLVVLCKQAGR